MPARRHLGLLLICGFVAASSAALAQTCDEKLASGQKQLDAILDANEIRLDVSEVYAAAYEKLGKEGKASLEDSVFMRMMLQSNCILLRSMVAVTDGRKSIAQSTQCSAKAKADKDAVIAEADGLRASLASCTANVEKVDAAILRQMAKKK